jgi:hypothetical protein
MAVPKFLCRLSTSAAAAEGLAQLERVVAREVNIFRFCSLAVLSDLVSFAKTEADAETAHALQAQKAHLAGFLSFCAVLRQLMAHERALQGVVDVGMFGALLEMLWRAAKDVSSSAGEGPLSPLADICKRASAAVQNSLLQLLECSHGAALLQCCMQDGGLNLLRRFATAEDQTLHKAAATGNAAADCASASLSVVASLTKVATTATALAEDCEVDDDARLYMQGKVAAPSKASNALLVSLVPVAGIVVFIAGFLGGRKYQKTSPTRVVEVGE